MRDKGTKGELGHGDDDDDDDDDFLEQTMRSADDGWPRSSQGRLTVPVNRTQAEQHCVVVIMHLGVLFDHQSFRQHRSLPF